MAFDWRGFLQRKNLRGESQVALSGRLGISQRLISFYLTGQRPFSWETKRRMANVWPELWGPLLEDLRQPWNGEEPQ